MLHTSSFRFVLAIAIIFSLLLSSGVSYAQSVEDIARMNEHTMRMKRDILAKIAGDQELKLGPLCAQTSQHGYMTRLEEGKLAYNHIFNDIKTAEQAADIKKLREDLGDVDDCKKNLRIWNAYDDKWYAAERNRQYAELQENKKKWLSQIEDRGPQYWDGVINGTFFSIPREHIWFGSRKLDGSSDINLIFHAPEMSAQANEQGRYGKHADIAGLLTQNFTRTYPCIGFTDKKECSARQFQRFYVQRALNCTLSGRKRIDEYYNARWRRACDFEKKDGFSGPPKFDESVGMMRLDDYVYFEGDPEFPTSYMICLKPDTKDPAKLKELYKRCDSAIEIDDNVYFYYGFPQSMFWEHKKLQAELKKKIQSFIVQSRQAAPGAVPDNKE